MIGNGAEWRLVYAPAKENSGNLTFKVKDMTEVNGRLILGAFHLLLRSQTVLNAPDKQHLHRLLEISREYQASVSTQLAEQVLAALYELLRGTQIAHDSSKGTLLADELKNNPDKIYEGLLTVLLRTVFLLFAEDRGLMPSGAVYSRNSVSSTKAVNTANWKCHHAMGTCSTQHDSRSWKAANKAKPNVQKTCRYYRTASCTVFSPIY